MNLFAEYLQPLTQWMQIHPYWSLFITFIVSLAESLAIIGSIIPGSVTMTAIGILAGSGVMRIDLTLLAAILGAVCGDSLSYALGYYYSDRLMDMWPFKKYPNWLKYGQDFFASHGGKSVLIGRFIGPLRSIIPVVAGVLHMKHWHFFIANTASAVGWAFLYVMPGILIGAASHELSAESATRLFILILCVLGGIWLITLLIKWALVKLHKFLKLRLDNTWQKLHNKVFWGSIYTFLTPKDESNHVTTAGLVLLAILTLTGSVILCLQPQIITNLNLPAHLFVQSFRTYMLEGLFIFFTQLISTCTLISLFLYCYLSLLKHKYFIEIVYLVSLLGSCILISWLLSYSIYSPRPQGLLVTLNDNSFPSSHLLLGTAFYSFVIFSLNKNPSLYAKALKTILLIGLGLSGFASLYLGDHWLSDVLGSYFIGTTLALFYFLSYRKSNIPSLNQKIAPHFILAFLMIFTLATSLSAYVNFHVISRNHAPYHQQYMIGKDAWWGQLKPILPIYHLNRIGKKISLLNIQYLGDIDLLQNKLSDKGWEIHSETFLTKLLLKLNNSPKDIQFPLLTQLYQNRRPELIMTYKDKSSDTVLELTMWQSNFSVDNLSNPIWIGTLHQHKLPADDHIRQDPLSYISTSLPQFSIKRISLPNAAINDTTFRASPYILLIK